MIKQVDENVIDSLTARVEDMRPSHQFDQSSEANGCFDGNCFGSADLAAVIGHEGSLSVGGVGSSTVATGGEAASLPAASAPALCTICDHRLEDPVIRACTVRACPHTQKDAA